MWRLFSYSSYTRAVPQGIASFFEVRAFLLHIRCDQIICFAKSTGLFHKVSENEPKLSTLLPVGIAWAQMFTESMFIPHKQEQTRFFITFPGLIENMRHRKTYIPILESTIMNENPYERTSLKCIWDTASYSIWKTHLWNNSVNAVPKCTFSATLSPNTKHPFFGLLSCIIHIDEMVTTMGLCFMQTYKHVRINEQQMSVTALCGTTLIM